MREKIPGLNGRFPLLKKRREEGNGLTYGTVFCKSGEYNYDEFP